MGYSITIGNAKPKYPDPSDGDEGVFDWEVDTAESPDAPDIPNDFQPKESNRRPSYSVWADFARETGLHELFFDRDYGMMRSHPGVAPITKARCAEVRNALTRYKAENPAAIARFCTPIPGSPFEVENEPNAEKNATLARLTWLDFWFHWALKNCEHPAIENG